MDFLICLKCFLVNTLIMFLKHLATPIEPFRDPLGGRDPQFEKPWFNPCFANVVKFILFSNQVSDFE